MSPDCSGQTSLVAHDSRRCRPFSLSLSKLSQPAASLHFDLLAVGASVREAKLQQEVADHPTAGSHHRRFAHLFRHFCRRFRDLETWGFFFLFLRELQLNVTVSPLVLCNSSPWAEEATHDESVLKVLGGMVMSCYAKYWIYVCGGMFIMVSFAGKLVGYKIVYMLLFLMCLCLYQVG